MVEAIGLGDPDPVLDEPSRDDELEPDFGHARVATPEPLATAPGALEQALHCLTHIPFARWCPICVKARAADQAHPAYEDQLGPE
eukprot:11398931-Heterocapsa_arctica.AAC.1